MSVFSTCKNYQNISNYQALILVGMAGFEPTTTIPPAWCATRLRYIPYKLLYSKYMLKILVLIAWIPFCLSFIFPSLFGDFTSTIHLIALATIVIHVIEFFVFFKRTTKNGLLEGFVMTFIFGYVYIRSLRKH